MNFRFPIITILLVVLLPVVVSVSAQVDGEMDTNDSSGEHADQVALEPDRIDITGTIIKFKHRARDTQDTLVATMHVRNNGSAILTDPFVVTMWLSEDAVLDIADVWLAQTSIDETPLNPGDVLEIKMKTVTDIAVDGRFAILALDGEDEISEIDEENNVLVHGLGGRGCRKDTFLREREGNQPRIAAMRRGDCLTIEGQISDGDSTSSFVVDRDSFVVPTYVGGTFHITTTFAENVDFRVTVIPQGNGRRVSGCVGIDPECPTRFMTASSDSSFVMVLAPSPSNLGGSYIVDILLLPDFPALRELE